MKVNGKMVKEKEKVYKFGMMVPNMKVNGNKGNLMAKEFYIIMMVIFMMVTGKMIKVITLIIIKNIITHYSKS